MPKKKEELSFEEKLKKAVISKEEEPYKIPDNWVWTRIRNVNEVITGNTPSKKEEKYWENQEINFIKPSDLYQGRRLNFSEEYVDERAREKVRILPKETTILCCIGSIGKSAFSEIECCTNQQINSLIPNNKIINSLYNYYFVNTEFFINKMKNESSATTIAILNKSKTENLLFPLPPLEEQKRIVKKLDSLFEKTQKIKEIIEEVKEKTIARRETILAKAFTGELTEKWRNENKTESAKELLEKINDEKLKKWEEEYKKAEEEGNKKPAKPKLKSIDEMLVLQEEQPYKIPDNWIWTRLGNNINLISGQDVSNSLCNTEKKGIPYILGASNIENNAFNAERWIENSKVVSNKGDILLSVKGTIGKIYLQKEEQINISRQIMALRTTTILQNVFLKYFLNFSLEKIKSQANGLIPGISRDIVSNLSFPLPPLEEQQEIVNILDNIFEKENKISELVSLENQIEILEKSILDKAFRGELGTNSEEDTNALELLKNIINEF